jgi:hypothetical protein
MSDLALHLISCLTSAMTRTVPSRLLIALPLSILVIHSLAAAAPAKPHIITFGKWTTVQYVSESASPITTKVRPLLVDAHVKEFTVGPAHDITERLFAVRRIFRVNDSLPQESTTPPHWQWQLGGWLLIDRATAHISSINLPEFDVSYSAASWYRDYAAYCGISDDGKKVYAVVAQISRRKPVLKKPLEEENAGKETAGKEMKDASTASACPTPVWQRAPTRVTFEPAGSPKQTFAIRGHAVDLVNESEEEDEEASK